MLDDGCDLNCWLRAGQMISSEGGVIRRRHGIIAPSLCVYGSLAATNNTTARVESRCWVCPCVCIQNVQTAAQKSKKRAEGLVRSHSLSHRTLWALCVFMCLFGCLVSEFSLDRGGFTPLGKTVQAEGSDKVTSAVLSERTRINTIPLTCSHCVLTPWVQ